MDEKDLEVQNYESNLKMHYEAKRKELDILLTSSIPQQLSNMKTILWINFLMIGLMLQFIKKFPLPEINIGFFILLILAIISVILAMLTNRTKSYGVPNDILQMSKYNDNVWTVSQATLDMLGNLQESIKENRKVIVNRAKLMHMSTWFTLCSIFFIVISFSIMQISYKPKHTTDK